MKDKISITLTSFTNEDDSIENQIEYNKYTKVDDEENLLTYKNTLKCDKQNRYLSRRETFNKLSKKSDNIKEVIGYSKNKKDWKIIEYTNNVINKKYNKDYKKLHLDVNYDMIKNCENRYLIDK
jgi:hypothetical protein